MAAYATEAQGMDGCYDILRGMGTVMSSERYDVNSLAFSVLEQAQLSQWHCL